eukprot:6661067-Lingulodinium_polyedra.AAC.1
MRCHNAPAAATVLGEAARGKDGPADVWGPEHWKDAVAVFVQTDALPALLSAAEQHAEHLPW